MSYNHTSVRRKPSTVDLVSIQCPHCSTPFARIARPSGGPLAVCLACGVSGDYVTLVEKGRLVTLLAGRAPLRGLLRSSGHTRGGDVQPGVFQLQSADAVPASELRRQYLELLKTQVPEHRAETMPRRRPRTTWSSPSRVIFAASAIIGLAPRTCKSQRPPLAPPPTR